MPCPGRQNQDIPCKEKTSTPLFPLNLQGMFPSPPETKQKVEFRVVIVCLYHAHSLHRALQNTSLEGAIKIPKLSGDGHFWVVLIGDSSDANKCSHVTQREEAPHYIL
jgi:hypothetical protein